MCRPSARLVKKTDAIFVVDAITGIGTMPLDIDGWGLDVVIGGSQKAFMIPPGLAFISVSPKAWKFADTATLPHYYFSLKIEKRSAAAQRLQLDSGNVAHSGARRSAEIHEEGRAWRT